MNNHHTIVYESTQNTIVLRISDNGRESLKTTFTYAGMDYENAVYWRCNVCGEVVPMAAVSITAMGQQADVYGGETTTFAEHAETHYADVQALRAWSAVDE